MKKEGKSLSFFVFYLLNTISSYICATNSGESELVKKARFSLYPAIVKLGHFCCKSWDKEKMTASIGL
jgi:hypothetical protein